MIEINLLPDEMRKGGKRRPAARKKGGPPPGEGISPLVWVVFALLLGVTMAGAVYVYKGFIDLQAEKERITQKEKDIRKEVSTMRDEIEPLQKIQRELATRVRLLESLDPPDKLIWSEKLNRVADLRNSSVFMTEIKLEEDVKEVETSDSAARYKKWKDLPRNDRGPEPKRVYWTKITYEFILSGVAVPDNPELERVWNDQALAYYLNFVTALTGDTTSPEDLEIGPFNSSKHITKIDTGQLQVFNEPLAGRRVMRWGVTVRTKALFDMEKDSNSNSNESDED